MASTNFSKTRPDPKDYQFCKLTDTTLVKLPGTINGLDFVLEDLTDCKVFLLDHSSQVQIDGCKRCEIVIGPIDGSAFFRDCSDCKVAVACRQLRTRDCHNVDFSLHVATDPVIESSSGVRFCPWAPSYSEADAQFKAANLNPGQNKWESVYNFTPPAPGDPPNWSVLAEAERPDWSVPILETLSKESSPATASETELPLEARNAAAFPAVEELSNEPGIVKPVGDGEISPAGPRDFPPGPTGESEAAERTPGTEKPGGVQLESGEVKAREMAPGAEQPGSEQLGSMECKTGTAVGEDATSSTVIGTSAESRDTGKFEDGADRLVGGGTQTPRLQECSSNGNGASLAEDASTTGILPEGGEGRLEERGKRPPADAPDASNVKHKKKQGVVTSVLQAVRRFFSRFALPWRGSARSNG